MPSGAKKRKAAKKKKVHNSSSTPHVENDGGELSAPASPDHQDPATGGSALAAVEVEKREDTSSENKNVTTNEEEGNIDIEIASKSKKSNGSSSSSSGSSSDDDSNFIEKKVVVLESAPVTIERLPEKVTEKVEEFAGSDSTIVEPVKPVDSFDDVKNVDEKALVVNEIASVNDCSSSSVVIESVLKENGVAELPLSDEKASSESKDYVSFSGASDADHAIEYETTEYSDRQPLLASTPVAVQKTTSWKGCCGILELFSKSERN